MSAIDENAPAGPGLRARKMARTRTEIREHALRLSFNRGYEATTVQQVADGGLEDGLRP